MKPGRVLLVLPLALVGACSTVDSVTQQVPTFGEIASILPGQGPANFPGTRSTYVMVDPAADCRRTIGESECTIFIAPPGRYVPLTPIIPGAAQIHPGNGGGDGRWPTITPIPTGYFLAPDGRLIPMTPEASLQQQAALLPPGSAPAATSGPTPVAAPMPPAKPVYVTPIVKTPPSAPKPAAKSSQAKPKTSGSTAAKAAEPKAGAAPATASAPPPNPNDIVIPVGDPKAAATAPAAKPVTPAKPGTEVKPVSEGNENADLKAATAAKPSTATAPASPVGTLAPPGAPASAAPARLSPALPP